MDGNPIAPTNPFIISRNICSTVKDENIIFTERIVNRKSYELANHLGNVLNVVSDKKLYNPVNNNYEAIVKSYNDYYPFGMVMLGRNGNSSDYRYSFNGMEKDDEVKGSGNSYTSHYRVFDPRVGRWVSRDPLEGIFSSKSPYNNNFNNPIINQDRNGNCPWCGVISGAIEWGSQAAVNLYKGKSLYDSFIGDVDFVDVGVATVTGMIPGSKLVKAGVDFFGGLVSDAIDYKPNEGKPVINNVSAKSIATNLAAASLGNLGLPSKTKSKVKGSATKTLDKANETRRIAAKNLSKSNRLVTKGFDRSRTSLPNQVFKEFKEAGDKLQVAEMYNNVVDPGLDVLDAIVDRNVKSFVKYEGNEILNAVESFSVEIMGKAKEQLANRPSDFTGKIKTYTEVHTEYWEFNNGELVNYSVKPIPTF